MKNPLEFVINLSSQVGNLLRDRFDSGSTKVDIKSDNSLITEADIMADEVIAQAIRSEFPEDLIISEELNSVLKETGHAIWVVDPLDGTTNYSLGVQLWGISIAYLVKGQPQCASIYFPVINELYSAEKNHGAFLNGKQIHTKAPDRDHPAPFFSCCSRTFRQYNVSIPYKTRVFGSASYTFCAVARGIAVLGFEATPKIWDIAAGWLLVTEAGGVIDTMDKQSLFPLIEGLDYSHQSYPTIVASAPDILTKARRHIKPKKVHSS